MAPLAASTMSRELSQLPGFLEFVDTRGQESRLRRMSPAGELLADSAPGRDLFPVPGPLSVAIAAPNSEEALEELVVLDASGVRSVGEKAGQIRNVVVSSDVRFAIFESNQASFRDLYRVDLVTGAQSRLTEDGDGAFDPSLSPDDKFVVFVTTTAEQADLHVITAEGKERRALTETRSNETSPRWSPDGTSIAFSSDADGPERLFVVGADGAPAQRVTELASLEEHEVEPLWSPRGDRLAYVVDNSAGRTELWVAEWPAGKSWRVSADEGHARLAQWSPDGRFLWYSDDTEGNEDIWAARADGSEVLRLGSAAEEQWLPRWRPSP